MKSRGTWVVIALLAFVAMASLVVFLAGSDDEGAPDPLAAPAPPGPPRAVRKRTREAADSAAPAPSTSDAKETPPPADAASLAVRVLAGGAAAKGASVSVTDDDCEEWSAATDADGDALFETLPPGATEVRVEAKGRLPSTKTVVLTAREKARLEISLEPAAALEGVLVDAATGAPIAGAEIEVIGKVAGTDEDRPLGEGSSDEKGRYRIDALPAAGQVTLRVREPGRRVRDVGVALGTDAGARIEIPREISGRLAGTVRRPDGLASATASVTLRRVAASPRDPPVRVADCREDGSYVFDDVPLDVELVAVASAKSWADAVPTEPMSFGQAAQDRRHDFTLRRPATLTVNVPDPSREGGPQSLLVMVRFDDEPTASALSNGSGTVLRSDLTPGTHRVRVTCNGFLPVERRVELPEGGTTEIEILLSPGLEIRGSVVNAAGKGVVGAAVYAIDPEVPDEAARVRHDLSQRAFVDDAGEFRFTGLTPGRYRLVAYLGSGSSSAPQVVDAPASGLRFVLAPGTKISLRVVLPAGVPAPASVAASAAAEALTPNHESEDSVALRPEPQQWKERSTLESEVPAGVAWLRIIVRGCAPAVIAVRTDAGKTADLGEVRLEAAAAVKGRVIDAKGGGLAGVSVWAAVDSSSVSTVRTRDDGTFEVSGLAPGAAIVRAQSGVGYGAATADAGGAAVTIELRPFGTVSGSVTDADGVVVKSAVVAARAGFSESPLDRGRVHTADAGEDGRFRMRVPSGRVRVSAGGAWIETTVPPEGETEVKVQRP